MPTSRFNLQQCFISTIIALSIEPFLKPEMAVSAGECRESIATVNAVLSCPKTPEEWREAAKRKNCSNIRHACSSFKYHCVINAWRNQTVEVCAPERLIVGNSCAEFNDGGNRIQRHLGIQCKTCPAVYDSIFSYKYQECYTYTQRFQQEFTSRDTTLYRSVVIITGFETTQKPFQRSNYNSSASKLNKIIPND